MAYPLEVLEDGLFLDIEFVFVPCMEQVAAAAYAEYGTVGLDAQGGGFDYPCGCSEETFLLPLVDRESDPIARQRIGNKERLLLVVGQSQSAVHDLLYLNDLLCHVFTRLRFVVFVPR